MAQQKRVLAAQTCGPEFKSLAHIHINKQANKAGCGRACTCDHKPQHLWGWGGSRQEDYRSWLATNLLPGSVREPVSSKQDGDTHYSCPHTPTHTFKGRVRGKGVRKVLEGAQKGAWKEPRYHFTEDVG